MLAQAACGPRPPMLCCSHDFCCYAPLLTTPDQLLPDRAPLLQALHRRPPGRHGAAATRPRAVLALDFVVTAAHPPAPANELTMVFASANSLAAAPECLLSLEELGPAPPLADGHGGARRAAPAAAQALHSSPSKRMEAAACLATPVLAEENAGAILRSSAAELMAEREAALQLRHAGQARLGVSAGGRRLAAWGLAVSGTGACLQRAGAARRMRPKPTHFLLALPLSVLAAGTPPRCA